MQSRDALKLLNEVQRVDPDMPLQQLMCLLIIAEEEEGISLTELARKANLSLTTASRYVAALGKMNRHREEGLNFVESYEDPMERRKKIIRTTIKGRTTLKHILGEKDANL